MQKSDEPIEQIYVHRNKRVNIPDGHMAVGLITGAHGIRGELKVELHTDFPERFCSGATLFMGDDLQPVEIEQSRPHKAQMLVYLRGVRGRDMAEGLRGAWLFIRDEDAEELDPGTYWVHDIVGLNVHDESGMELGVVRQVLVTGANDVYIIRPVGDVNRGRDLLLPALPDVVVDVDVERGVMQVCVPTGLIES